MRDKHIVVKKKFDFELYGMPAFPGRWCIMTTMPRVNIYEEVDRVRDSNGTVRVTAIIGAAIAIVLMGQALVRATLTASQLTRQNYEKKVERVTKAAKSITSCGFSVCFCKYAAFKRYGKFIPHEHALVKGDLVFLHTYQDVLSFVSVFPTVFFSHQWLDFAEPDPNCDHYKSVCAAAQELIKMHSLEESNLFVWIDYLSIPQRNPILKGLSISSLGVYASVCKYFVVVAPPVSHKGTAAMCNEDTYQRRGWCRLEQWARIAVGGFIQMYLYTGANGGALDPLVNKPKWLRDSIHVFEGDFTVEADKLALVDTVCGVWAHALRSKSEDGKQLVKLVMDHRESIFPTSYFGDLVDILEDKINLLQFDEMVCKQDALPAELVSLGAGANIKVQTGMGLQQLSSSTMTLSSPPKLPDVEALSA